jgi:hypothetical protein
LCGKRHGHGLAGLEDGSLTHRAAQCNREAPPLWVRKLGKIGVNLWQQALAQGYFLKLMD